MNKLSAYIITLNEGERLERALASLKDVADEIVVVDSGSTDNTEQVAKKYGAKFIFNDWEGFASQKHFAQELCKNDWVLNIDADEALSDGLQLEIKNIINNPGADAYLIKIGNVFPGDVVSRKYSHKPYQIRLYNKNKANLPSDLLKDKVVLAADAEVVKLGAEIYHYKYEDIYSTWEFLNQYTDDLAKKDYDEKRHFSKFRLYSEFPVQFVNSFVIKREAFNGVWGLIDSITDAYFKFARIAKVFEKEKMSKRLKK